ncbi:MAG: hypothetical protein NC200_07825 [Candidatus Gastranaerophilales bacterium]|nr:hypothetical protein [Candidatus Gastranaerophilales bacterium]
MSDVKKYMNFSALKYPPIPPKKLPDRLIYRSGDTFKMFSLKEGKQLGIMVARPDFVTESGIYPKKKNFWAYYVVGLQAKVRGQGVGKDFEKLLRKIAKDDEKCQGRIYLRAYNNIDADHKASSTWWHARGYRGCDKNAQNDLERVLRHQKPKYGAWYMDMEMYLPPEKIK